PLTGAADRALIGADATIAGGDELVGHVGRQPQPARTVVSSLILVIYRWGRWWWRADVRGQSTVPREIGP
ncbi:MAG: hypothetical protein M3395_06815, partial [Chloroflexota bacterium]|nr:hypothetical protein [Chloroflexota bacterium]